MSRVGRLILIILAVMLAGCAIRLAKDNVSERDISNEETPIPEPKARDLPSAEDEAGISAYLDKELKKSGTDHDKKNSGSRAASPPAPSKPTPPEPPPTPTAPPKSIAKQDAPITPDSSKLKAAFTDKKAGSRSKAALTLTQEGRELLAQKKDYLAEKRLEKALSIDPSCGQAYLAFAELRFSEEKWQEAGDLASKAALRFAKDPYFLSRAHLLAAKAMVNDGNPRSAYNQALQAVKADPDNQEAKALCGDLEAHLGLPSSQSE